MNRGLTMNIGNIQETLSDCISATSFWSVENVIADSAWLEHAPFAFWLTESLRPRTFVELGTHGGFSFFAFCQAVQRLDLDTKCYAVDTWKGDEHSGHYDEQIFGAVNAYNNDHYRAFSSLVRSTFDEASAHFSDGTIDLLHIDGRHFYDDVEHDYETWRPKLSDRAIVLFHDTNVRERGFGVFKLWEKLQNSHPSFEFVHGHGLGVLGVGRELTPPLKALFKASESEHALVSVKASYARLGSAIATEAKNFLLEHDVQYKSQELERLKSTAEQNDHLVNENHDLKSRLSDRESEMASLTLKLAEVGGTVGRLQSELVAYDSKFHALRDSTSWRVTRPLRVLSRVLGRKK